MGWGGRGVGVGWGGRGSGWGVVGRGGWGGVGSSRVPTTSAALHTACSWGCFCFCCSQSDRRGHCIVLGREIHPSPESGQPTRPQPTLCAPSELPGCAHAGDAKTATAARSSLVEPPWFPALKEGVLEKRVSFFFEKRPHPASAFLFSSPTPLPSAFLSYPPTLLPSSLSHAPVFLHSPPHPPAHPPPSPKAFVLFLSCTSVMPWSETRRSRVGVAAAAGADRAVQMVSTTASISASLAGMSTLRWPSRWPMWSRPR